MTYQHTERYESENLHASPYNFTKDFDGIARPGLVRYLEHFGCAIEPEEGEDPADFDLMDSSDEAREYLGLTTGAQRRAGEPRRVRHAANLLSRNYHLVVRERSRVYGKPS